MKSISKQKILIAILTLFSLLINQYYGNKGIFPVDSLSHFDTGSRILLGEYPFKNYWIISGPFVDYVQAIFFYIFGVNWQSYVLHASFINAVLSVATFLFFRNFSLNIYASFIYALLFSILAYPTSGTPFVDHHSAFFSLLGIYSLILGIKNESKIHWLLLPILFGLAFLSKQVPSSYIILSSILVLVMFSLIKKKFYWIKYSFLSSIFFILFLFVFGKFQQINLSSFLEQYLLYPQSIGVQRFEKFNFTYRGAVDHFKFIYIAIIPLFYVNFKKIFFENKYYKSKDFYYFLTLVFLTFSLILHQLLTRNQTFIFFLIPILFGFSHISIDDSKASLKNMTSLILIAVCLFVSIKYHVRFNENRKFHELNYVDFKLSEDANEIDKIFFGLKWITPEYKDKPDEEIILINQIKSHLLKDKRKKMLWTNYSFFSSILNEKLFSPTRWHIFDGTDYPQKENKYFTSYKKMLVKLIKDNNISVIYTIYPVEGSLIYTYLDESCFTEIKISKILYSYEIKNCNEING